jgi:hypothetical protein
MKFHESNFDYDNRQLTTTKQRYKTHTASHGRNFERLYFADVPTQLLGDRVESVGTH